MFSHLCTYMCVRARICVRPLETRTKLVSRCGACQVAPSVCRDSMRAAARVRDPRRLRHDSPNSLRTAHVQTLTPDTASLSPGAYPSPLPSFFFLTILPCRTPYPAWLLPHIFSPPKQSYIALRRQREETAVPQGDRAHIGVNHTRKM